MPRLPAPLISALASLVALFGLSTGLVGCGEQVAHLRVTDDGGAGMDSGRLSDGGCPSGSLVCDGACVDPMSDPLHCGGCTSVCEGSVLCVSGSCGCPATMIRIEDRCIDTQRDPERCGVAEVTCEDDERCVAGECICREGLTLVGEVCVDLRSDPMSCGAPGASCEEPSPSCEAGSCAAGCSAGLLDCEGACIDPSRDPMNCGECGRPCGSDELCVSGLCQEFQVASGCLACPCERHCGEERPFCCTYSASPEDTICLGVPCP